MVWRLVVLMDLIIVCGLLLVMNWLLLRMIIWLVVCLMGFRLCDERMIVMFVLVRLEMMLNSCLIMLGLRLFVGLLRMIMVGFLMSVCLRLRRCVILLESVFIWWFVVFMRLMCFSMLVMFMFLFMNCV